MGADITLAFTGCIVAVVGCVASVVVPVHGPRWHLRALERRTERVETRRVRRVRRLVETGHITAATELATHNRLDAECTYWVADMRPPRNDERNREFDRTSTPLAERRCVVCRPYSDSAELTLIDHTDTLSRQIREAS